MSIGAGTAGPSNLPPLCVAVGTTEVQRVRAVVGQPIWSHSKEEHTRTLALTFEMKR